MLLYYMMNENLLCLVILTLVIIVLFFYLFKVEKFTALSQEEYDQTRDLVLEEIDARMVALLEQDTTGQQPNQELINFYAEQKEKLEKTLDDSQLKNFMQQEQNFLANQDLMANIQNNSTQL